MSSTPRKKVKKNYHINKFFTFFAIIAVIFIWTNSLQVAEVSGEVSEKLARFILKIFNLALGINVSFGTFHHIIRKLAHFSEYLIYGFLLKGAINVRVMTTLFTGLFTAVIDESIQYFVPGRAAAVKDVLIDFSGFLVGTIIFWIMRAMWHEFQNTVIADYKERQREKRQIVEYKD